MDFNFEHKVAYHSELMPPTMYKGKESVLLRCHLVNDACVVSTGLREKVHALLTTTIP